MEAVTNEVTVKAVPAHVLSKMPNFMVVSFVESSTKKRFTAVGEKLPEKMESELHGVWITHKKYGQQLKVHYFEEVVPSEEDRLIKYIEYLKIGLGYASAKRLVKMYGQNAVTMLDNVDALLGIKGMSRKKAESVRQNYLEKADMKQYFSFLSDFQLQPSQMQEAYKMFSEKKDGFENLKKRPYLLCACPDISFEQVDRTMRTRPDFDPYSKDRVRFGILAALLQNEASGHVFCAREVLIQLSMNVLCRNITCDQNMVYWRMTDPAEGMLNWMCRQQILKYSNAYPGGAFYRKPMWDAEDYVAQKLIILKNAECGKAKPDKYYLDIIDSVSQEKGMKLASQQIEAIAGAMKNQVYVLTGGPGTGKTTTLRVLLDCLRAIRKDAKIVLCAPTGRAARKMTENTGEEAGTIHHTVGLANEAVTLDVDKLATIDADVVVMDESSMASMELMYALTSCVKSTTKLILIGDKDQLPSVTAGDVFAEIIRSGVVPMTRLTQTYRQANGSSIIDNAKAINEGRNAFHWDDSSHFINAPGENNALNATLEMAKRIAAEYGPDAVQVLSPLRNKTQCSVSNLNEELQKILNPYDASKPELKSGKRTFRVGDRVIHLKNEEGVSNGDVGIITDINTSRQITVRFETDFTKTYESDEFVNLDHAYALTVHKSQGSEYMHPILPFISQFGLMRQKKLLYTAVTRAKKQVTIVGDFDSLLFALGNEGTKRNTMLADRIVSYNKKAEKEKRRYEQ